ncbi:MAG: nucleotide pyrophosphohydrolase [Pseudomonadales bacterium]|nr:nucleotide pyrophosphohydrolase [Pseudomonadales bacterium]
MDLDKIRKNFERLADEQKWQRFHSPKNLSMALMVEVGELLEHFQWLDEAASKNLKDDAQAKAAVASEIADVFMYLLALADKMEIDLPAAVDQKMAKVFARYQ